MTYEVDTDGRDVGLGVGVICEAQKQAGLADTRVADQEELEEVVAVPHKGKHKGTHHERTDEHRAEKQRWSANALTNERASHTRRRQRTTQP